MRESNREATHNKGFYHAMEAFNMVLNIPSFLVYDINRY